MKHGITLDTTVGSYLSADGDVLFDDATYWNNILALGKDGVTGLDQRISKSQMGNASLIVSVSDDVSSLSREQPDVIADKSFLVIGSDGESRGSAHTLNLDTTKYVKRVKRQWKVVNTNFNTPVTLKFTNSVSRNNYQKRVLLWDADGDFNSGSVELGTEFDREFSVNSLDSGYLALAFAEHYPTSADNSIAVTEDSYVSLSASDFPFADLNEDHSLYSVTISSLNIQGTLTVNGNPIAANDVIDAADLSNVVYTPPLNAAGDNYASFTFRVNNKFALSQSDNSMTFNVANLNDAPLISGSPITTIAEDSTYSFTPTVTDADAVDTTTFSITNKPVWATFNTATGLLSGTPTNSNVGVTSNIVISVSDVENATDDLAAFSITVTNTNDAPVISGTPATEIAQGSAYSFTPSVTDVDVEDGKTFSITNKPTWASFDTATGALTGTPDNSHVDTTTGVLISVSDGNGGSDSLGSFDIEVTNVNDAPLLGGTPATTAPEDALYSFTPSLTDIDAGDTHIFSITNKPSWTHFDPATGALTGTPNNSHIGDYTGIVITVTDSANAANSLPAFAIEVTNTNDAPVISGAPSTTVNEDSLYQFVPNVSDDDSGDTHTFSIIGKPSWANFDTTNGTLSGTPTNGDVRSHANIVISVQDAANASASLATFTITVANTNDAPTISGAPAVSVAQGAAYSFTPTINDVDTADSYSVDINTKPSWASFDTATGALTGTPTNDDVGTTANIVITVTDNAGANASLAAYSLTVTNVNDAPVISGTPAATVAEDASYAFTPSVADIDVGDSHTFSITNKPSWLTLNASTGALTGTPTNDDVGTTSSMVMTVEDSSGATDDLAAFTITVTNTNDAPVISGSPVTSVNQDAAYSFTPVVTDVDSGDTKVFTITNMPTWTSFDTATGALTGTPTNGDVGTTTGIVISVKDAANASAALAAFNLVVNNVNDAPVISGSPAITVAQDAAYSFTPVVTDADSGDSKAFSITNKPSWASFDNATGALTGTPGNSDVGNYPNITITVTDGANASDSLTAFAIDVTNVNDAPIISGTPATTVAEDAAYSFTPAANDIDSGDTKTFSITNKPTWAAFSTTTGALTGKPDNSHVGTTSNIVISVEDAAGATASLTAFNIAVTNTNDAPVISGSPTTSVNQGAVYSFVPGLSDDDALDSHTFSITNKPSWASFDSSNGALTGTPSNSDVGAYANIVISVTDSQSASDSLTAFTITVADVNDAPTISGTPATSVLENQIYNFVPTADDIDVGDTLTFSITSKPDWASFNTSTGQLTGTPVNADVGTDSNIVISVTDGNSPVVSLASFNIEVVNVNQAPALANESFSIDENSANNTNVGTALSAVDPDVGSSFTYNILNGNTGNAFKIDNGGQIAVNDSAQLNFESKANFALTVEVSDGALTDTAIVSIAINDVVEVASFIIEDIVSTDVAEDSIFTSPVASINGTPIGNVTYTIGDGDAGLFSVDSATGQLTLAAKDFENPTDGDTNNTYDVTLTATDDDGNTAPASITVTVTNTNVAPVLNGVALVDQNQTEGFTSYTLDFTVEDADQDKLTISAISSDSNIATAIVSPSSELTYAQYNGTTYQVTLTGVTNKFGSVDVTIVVKDQHELTVSKSFNIVIPAVLDFPTLSANNIVLSEDSPGYELTLTNFDFLGEPSVDVEVSYSQANVLQPIATSTVTVGNDKVLTLLPVTNANGDFTATITVDADGTRESQGVSVSVTPVNDAPTISGTPALATELVAYSWTPIFDDIDNDNNTLTFSASNLPGWASINTATGEISGTPTVHDDGVTNNVVVSVTDGSLSASITVSITVNNVNQAPDFTNTSFSVAENTADNTLVATHTATDIDSGSLTYAIVSGNTDNAFAVNNSGEIRVNAVAALNYEQTASFDLEISATDGDGLSDNAIVTINLNDVNEVPTISGTPSTSTLEDNVYSFTPTANDVDAGDTLTFSISGKPTWANFDTSDGHLTGIPTNSDLGTGSNIVITVTDAEGLNVSLASFDIVVSNTNDAPVISGAPATSVDEDGSYSFTPVATDADVGDTKTFSITNEPAWASFDTATGELSGTPNNSDVGTTTGIVIAVTDALGASDSLTAFDLTVNNVNDAPSISGTPAVTVAQGADYTFTPSVTDIDIGDTQSFSITNKPSWASFNTATGELSGTPANGDVNTYANILISVQDAANATAYLAAFSIEVTNVNDAPVISGAPATSVAQDASYSFTPSVTDIDVGDSQSFTITNQPSWASFNPATGQLSGTPDNADVGSYSNIVISVSDSANARAQLPAFSILVTNVNDAPVLSGTPAVTVAQGASYSFTPSLVDIDVGDSATFSITNKPTWASFSTVTGALSGTPSNDELGTTNAIVITVVDGSGASDSLTAFNLEVTNVNDAPTIIGTPITSISQGDNYSFAPVINDIDSGDTYSVAATGLPTWLTIDTATGVISGTPANGDVGATASIVITVTDAAGASTSLTGFVITVGNVNDAPVISGTPATSVDQDASYSFTPVVVDVDTGDSKVFSITNKPTWATFDTATGALTGTPDNSHVGLTSAIVITVTDGAGESDSLTAFDITVNNVNDAPTISGTPNTSIAQDAAYSFTPSVNDIDLNDTLNFSIANPPSWASFDVATGALTGTPSNSDVGSYAGIVITVTDAANAQALLPAFTISVSNVNDAPVITGSPATTVDEDASYSFVPSASDVDTNDSTVFSITNQPSWASFDTATGALTGTPDNSHVGVTSGIVITVTDSAGASDSLTAFNITVNNINDEPTISGAPATTIAQGASYSFVPVVTDPDVGDSKSFSITNAPSWLSFNSSTGALSGTPSNDDIGTAVGIVISVTDGGGAIASLAAFNLTVTNTNDAPVISGTPATSVLEGNVYSFAPVASDIDAGDSLTFAITNKPDWASFDTATGQLSGTPTNGDVGTTSAIVISVSDSDNVTASLAAFNLEVVNVNQAPALANATFSIDENSVANTPVGTPLVVVDPDAASTFSFAISNGDLNNAFAISNSGQLSVQTASELDFEAKTSYALTITVTDDGGLTDTANVVVNINDVTEVVNFTIGGVVSANVNENSEFQSPVATLSQTPIGVASYSISGADAGLFTIDSATGQLTLAAKDYELPQDSNTNNSYVVDLTAVDSDGNTDTKAITISVQNVNVAPTLSSTELVDMTQAEDFGTVNLGFMVDDADKDDVTLSVINSDTSLVTATVDPTTLQEYADYNGATFNLALDSIANQFGSANIQLVATDMYGVKDVMSFNLAVPAVLDFPSINNDNISLNEDFGEYEITLTGLDFNGESSLTIDIAYDTPNVVTPFSQVTVNSPQTTQVIKLTALADANGSAIGTITVTAGASTVSKTINITVNAINDAPIISGTPPAINEGVVFNWTPTFDDIDNDNNLLTFSASNLPTWLTLDTDTGAIIGTPSFNDGGVYNDITLSVSDGDLSSSLTVSISVNEVNQAPMIIGNNFSLNELTANGQLLGIISAQDNDGDNLSFSITNGNTDGAFAIDNNGRLSVSDSTKIDYEEQSNYALTVEVSDPDLLRDSTLVFIDITNVNETPSISGTPTTSIDQGDSYNFTPVASDPDAGDELSFSITNKPDWLSFDEQTGQLSGVSTNGDVGIVNSIIISVTDSAGAHSELPSFSITVNNVNDAPQISGSMANVANEDALFDFTPAATDIDVGDSLIFSIVNKPSWASFDTQTGRLSGTPLQPDIGVTHNVIISVEDSVGENASLAPMDIVVVNTNNAPVVSGVPKATVAQGANYSFIPTVTDEDIGDTMTFSVSNMPSWVSFNTATGELSGTPSNDDVGNYSNISISVTDAGGLSAALNSFVITVTNVNDAPTIAGIPAISVNQGVLYSFTPSAGDIDAGDSKVFSIKNMPNWASFNTVTGQLSGTPANEHVDSYSNIVISVKDSGELTASLAPFTINVVNVNDAPTLEDAAISVAEDTAIGSNIGHPLVANDIDDATTLTFSIIDGNDAGKFNITNAGQLQLVSALDFETTTSYQLTARVSDGELHANATVTITVTEVLDGDDKHISDITDAVNSGDTSKLTIDVYTGLGITGVTAEIIEAINARIATVSPADLPLTTEQIQAIVDEVISLRAINTLVTTGEDLATLTITDFENLGVTGVTVDNLAAVLALISEQTAELTIEQIQTLVNQVIAFDVINDFISNPDDATEPSVSDFETLNITGVTNDNIAQVLAMLGNQTGELTVEEIQALIDEMLALAKINQFSTSQGTSDEPILSDFAAISIHSLSDDTYAQLLDALRDNPAIRSIDDIKALIATLAQGDSDGDGLSNELEATIGSNPNDANSPFVNGNKDADNDGVSNAIEGHLENLGGATAPQTTMATDTDSDGLPDVLELAKGFDPIDVNNPTNNGDEVASNGITNAVNAYLTSLGLAVNGEISKANDYDRDGYNDALEIVLGSDPQSSGDNDVDLDGVPDVVEAYLTATIDDGIDTKTLDLNSNGLSDAYEVRQAATLSELRQLLAAQEKVDSDGDGISDAVEAFITGDDNDLSVTPTSDADNDGIADVDEILAGSDPLRNDIPVLWIENTMLNDTTLMLDTYFGGLPSSKVNYAWQLNSLTEVGMSVSATDVKQPQVTNLVGGLYLVSVTVTRDINGEQLSSTATHVVNIDSVGDLAVNDSDGDGVADSVDTDNGNTGSEETIPTKIEANDTFKMVTDNGVKLRLGVVAILSGQNGSEVSEENIEKFGNGQGESVSADLANDDGFDHVDTFDYEAVNLPHAGASINVFIPLSEPIPAQASLRKFNPVDGWKPYDTSGGDSFATAPAVSNGVCSSNVSDYSAELTEGDMCLLLVISDGGNNDADGEINGMIQDPIAVSAPEKTDPVTPPPPKPPVEPPAPEYKTGTKGGSTSLIVLLGLTLLMLARRRRYY